MVPAGHAVAIWGVIYAWLLAGGERALWRDLAAGGRGLEGDVPALTVSVGVVGGVVAGGALCRVVDSGERCGAGVGFGRLPDHRAAGGGLCHDFTGLGDWIGAEPPALSTGPEG